jgi:hypothetical protein
MKKLQIVEINEEFDRVIFYISDRGVKGLGREFRQLSSLKTFQRLYNKAYNNIFNYEVIDLSGDLPKLLKKRYI